MSLDVFEEGNNVSVKASTPGFKPDEIHVQVRNDVASIWGKSKSNDEKKDRNYHMREHRFSRIERSVLLPADADGQGRSGL
jgi:HSP20 family protein